MGPNVTLCLASTVVMEATLIALDILANTTSELAPEY